MLNMEEAQNLICDFVKLKKRALETQSKEDVLACQKQKSLCMEKFEYIVRMRTGRYKSFANYEDLNQEGREALVKAMNSYDPIKGNFFAWAHNYIGTRVSRSANLHTTIRYPLKVAKAIPPHKETSMPVQIEERFCPDQQVEVSEIKEAIREALSSLTKEEQEVIALAYGFDGDKPLSINKICKQLNLSRSTCLKIISNALSIMKEDIKI